MQAGFQRPLSQQLFYRAVRASSRLLAVGLLDFRTSGREHIPANGGGIVLSTHQSMFDPVLVGILFNRRLNYLARKSLFQNRLFARVIRFLDAIEIDRDRSGLSGLREMLNRLNREELVLVFPEGTRTYDGSVGELKGGFVPVARRSRQPIIPVAVVGAFDVLPRGSRIPTRHPIAVVIGELITSDQIARLDNPALIAYLQLTLEKCNQRARSLLHLRAAG